VYNGKLYFSAYHPTYGTELWSYDSTASFPQHNLAWDINSGANDSNPKWLTVFDNSLFMSADNGSNGTELRIYYEQLPKSITIFAVPGTVFTGIPIVPAVRVVLQDQYGNRVYQSGVQIRLSLRKANNTHSPNLLGGPVTVTTNANGLARFVGLTITAPGTYKFRARVLNISGIPVILSNPFQVV
jgi:ELWxxDGT repeat protein